MGSTAGAFGTVLAFGRDQLGSSYLVAEGAGDVSTISPGSFQTASNGGGSAPLIWKLSPSPASAIAANDSLADAVLGQTSFGPGGINLDSGTLGVNSAGVNFPIGIAIDVSVTPNRLYAADSVNNRVLRRSNIGSFTNGAAANLMIGQPDFVSSTCNNGVLGANTLCSPLGTVKPTTPASSISPTAATTAC